MALFNKLNRMAKTFGEFANDALEAGREALNKEAREADRTAASADADRIAAQEQFQIIGEYYYNIYLQGGEVAGEVLEACEKAKMHMEAIAVAEEEERLRREEEERQRREAELSAQQDKQEGLICPECGASNRDGTKFCGECGTKLIIQAPKARFCGECGAEVEAGRRFCSECGNRMDE